MASRFVTYAVTLDDDTTRYVATLLGAGAMRAWTAAALQETHFVPMDEPYATA